jgi:type II secretory pathway pseudopilin PulG
VKQNVRNRLRRCLAFGASSFADYRRPDPGTDAAANGRTLGRSGLARRGFSLVELFVVTIVISAMIALLLPAIQSSRESSRRAQCSRNQQQIAVALRRFESSKKCFPGFADAIITGYNRVLGITFSTNVSWALLLLPDLGRKDIHDAWMQAIKSKYSGGTAYGRASFVGALACPSDLPQDGTNGIPWLSYVVNRGRNGWNDNPAVGVCFDQTYSPNGYFRATVGLDYIQAHDGAAGTLLLAESPLTPQSAAAVPPPSPAGPMHLQGPSGYAPPNKDGTIVPTGEVYGYRPKSQWLSSAPPGQAEWQPPMAELSLAFEWSALGTRADAKVTDQIASRHRGVIIVSFCDGHQMPLADSIHVDVFKHLMTPSGEAYTAPDAPPGTIEERAPQ